jgi:sulfate permease, SulP family
MRRSPVPPIAGVWAALPALVIYAALGSSQSLSMGPESTTALMTAVAIGPLAAGNPGAVCRAGGVTRLAGGVLSVCAGLVRLGFAADLLSRPVLVGYLAGVALIMIAGQLGRVTGGPVTGSSFAADLSRW